MNEQGMNDDEQIAGESAGVHPPLRAVEGGRAALERRAMWAVALGQPEAEALMRRLDRPASASLSVVPDSSS